MFMPKVIACEKCYELVDTREEPESDINGVTLCKNCREELDKEPIKTYDKVINFPIKKPLTIS